MSADVADVMVNELALFIAANIAGLTVLQEFPYANQQLTYPSLTISTTKPVRTPIMPYIDTQADPVDGVIVANFAVAEWDDVFQLDLWCRDKLERKTFTDAIISLFNSQENPPLADSPTGANQPDGLSIVMSSYYNEPARFEIRDMMCVDNEAAAQRQERREKISVLANCMEIRQRSLNAITNIETYVGTDDTDDNTDNTDESTLPT